jgi:hypothetical protein
MLSFGFGDQIDLVDDLVEAFHRASRAVDRRTILLGGVVSLLGVAAVALLWRLWRRGFRPWRGGSSRARGPASRAVHRLARALIPVGGVVPPWATVRTIGRQAVSFWPQSGREIDELVERAENELYGAGEEAGNDVAEIRQLWKTIRRGMKHRELTVRGN